MQIENKTKPTQILAKNWWEMRRLKYNIIVGCFLLSLNISFFILYNLVNYFSTFLFFRPLLSLFYLNIYYLVIDFNLFLDFDIFLNI